MTSYRGEFWLIL